MVVKTACGVRHYRIWAVGQARRRLKAQAVAYKGGKCERCGYSRCHEALDFHHLDADGKDFGVSAGIYRKWEVVRAELDKCVMLCANCHREEHARQREAWLKKQQELARLEVPARPQMIPVDCLNCGSAVLFAPSRIARGTRLFCDARCAGKYQRKAQWPPAEELKALVWRVPASQLAKQLGVSSPAIKKMCRRLGIETPGRGYWSTQKLLPP